MKLRFEQLDSDLKKNLATIYWLMGDEPVLVAEAQQLILAAARARGFTERVVMHEDSTFSWQMFSHKIAHHELFSERSVLELRLTHTKLSEDGGLAIKDLCAALPSHKIILIMSPKLEASQQRTNWYKALDQVGIIVPIWPIKLAYLPRFIAQQLSRRGMETSAVGVQLLVEAYENNLLSILQAVEKLHINFGATKLTPGQIKTVISEQARFDVFDLAEIILTGAVPKVIKILTNLRHQGVEPPIILWAIMRELRLLTQIAFKKERGNTLENIFADYKLWDKQQFRIKNILGKHQYSALLERFPKGAAIDRMIKGIESGNVWDELVQICI